MSSIPVAIDSTKPVTLRLNDGSRVKLTPVSFDEQPSMAGESLPRPDKYLRQGLEISGDLELDEWRNPSERLKAVLDVLASVGVTHIHHSWDSEKYNNGVKAFLSSGNTKPGNALVSAIDALTSELGAEVLEQKPSKRVPGGSSWSR